MDPAPIRRWNPGFIAMRWRHVIGLIALTGLLSGLAFLFKAHLSAKTATGTVLVTSLPATASGLPPDPPQTLLVKFLRSDAVLAQMIIDLDLQEDWRAEEEECAARLRGKIMCRQVRNTRLIEISVKGQSRPEAVRLWNKLIELANNELSLRPDPHQMVVINELQAEIELRRKQLNLAQKAVELAIRSEAYADRNRKRPQPDALPNLPETLPNFPGPRPASRSYEDVIATRNKAKADLETTQGKLIKVMADVTVKDRSLVVQLAPITRTHDSLGVSLLSILKFSTLGLAAGTLLALILSYLLELFFPRKRLEEIA